MLHSFKLWYTVCVMLSNSIILYKCIRVVIFHSTSSPKIVLQMEWEYGNKNIIYPYPARTHGKGFRCTSAMVVYHLTAHSETNPLISRYELCLGSIKIHLSYCPVNHLASADYVLVMSFCPRVPIASPPHTPSLVTRMFLNSWVAIKTEDTIVVEIF